MTGAKAPQASHNYSEDPKDWVELHGDYLYRYVYARVLSRTLAEDLVQDTYVSACSAFKDFGHRSSVRTWLVSILRNKIIDHFRRQRHRQFVELKSDESAEQLFNIFGRWRNPVNHWDASPDRLVEEQEFLVVLQNCLGRVSDRMRQVFILKVIDQMRTREISQALGISENSISLMMSRSRLQLRECLEQNWFHPAKRA